MDCDYFELDKLTLPESEDDCPDCDGRGNEHDCPDCECICPSCRGSGIKQPNLAVGIGNSVFSSRLVLLMQTLPGLLVGETNGTKPMPFRFEGGDGLVMPMNRPDVDIKLERRAL